MNLKALITTLVLGSSTMASADSLSFSGSVKVSLGGSTSSSSSGGIVRDYHPSTPARPPVVVVANDDCHDHVPAPKPYTPVVTPRPQPVYQPPVAEPVWRGPYFNITNTFVAANGSTYRGWLANSPTKARASIRNKVAYVHHDTSWFDLTEATRIDNGRELFNIGADNGLFRGLKLQALGNGSSKISFVLVEYADRHGAKKSQLFKTSALINRNNPTITLDFDGGYRAVSRIVVYGSTDRGSAYKLQAM